MTQPDNALDPLAILAALDFAGAARVEFAHGGSDTAIWRVERAGDVFALRVFRQGEEAACERERVVMQAASAAGAPVPAVHTAGSWRGRPALLLTWAPGWPVADELRRRPWRAWRMGVIFGQMQAKIHAIAAPDLLAGRPNAWIDWMGADEPALAQRLRDSYGRRAALLHLDYHPLNVVTDGERITGVLDWRNAEAGEPRADAARTLGILQVGFPGRSSPRVRFVKWVFQQGWRVGYQRQAGPLREMAPLFAWAGAVMLRDLASKRSPADLARIRRWTEQWLARAQR